MKRIFLAIALAMCASSIAFAQDITPHRELDRQTDEDILIKNPYSMDYYTGKETVKGSKITYNVWMSERGTNKYLDLVNSSNKKFSGGLKCKEYSHDWPESLVENIIMSSIPENHLSVLEKSKGEIHIVYYLNTASGKIENLKFVLYGEKDDGLIFSITPREIESIEMAFKDRCVLTSDMGYNSYDIYLGEYFVHFYKGLHVNH